MEFNKEMATPTAEEFESLPIKEANALGDELMWYRIFEFMQAQHTKHPTYSPLKLLIMFYDTELENIMDEDDYEDEEDEDEDSV